MYVTGVTELSAVKVNLTSVQSHIPKTRHITQQHAAQKSSYNVPCREFLLFFRFHTSIFPFVPTIADNTISDSQPCASELDRPAEVTREAHEMTAGSTELSSERFAPSTILVRGRCQTPHGEGRWIGGESLDWRSGRPDNVGGRKSWRFWESWYSYVGIPAMLGAYCVIVERQGASRCYAV
jgi:hypothetical protein